MKIAMVGLGKMGANMSLRLIRGGHTVIGFDPRAEAVDALKAEGGGGGYTLAETVAQLDAPRTVWIMVPSGKITENTVSALGDLLAPGDTVIDGGNSNYKETMRRAALLSEKDIHMIDVGTSGGIWGLAEGYSMMVGGETDTGRAPSPSV